MENKFTEIYKANEWGYGSGVGSLPLNNIDYMKFIKMFIERNDIRSVVDFGCGDWQFSRYVGWETVTYTGFDIVESVVAQNQSVFGRNNVSFRVFRSETELPSADLLICKDVFQHLSNKSIQRHLRMFKPRYGLLLITNDDWPAEHLINAEIDDGGWRPIRLDREPFFEIAPIVLSWMIEWGGWKPTRKVTSLISGEHAGIQAERGRAEKP
jgi:SAM-dependent methyltransferase